MAEINIVVDGKSYSIACDDGQEARVQNLGRFIDQRLREVTGSGGAANKNQLMVLTALMLADEVFDLRDHLQNAANSNEQLKRSASRNTVETVVYEGLDPDDEKQIMDVIGKLSAKVDNLSKRVKK